MNTILVFSLAAVKLWRFPWIAIRSNERWNDKGQGHLRRVGVLEASQEHRPLQ